MAELELGKQWQDRPSSVLTWRCFVGKTLDSVFSLKVLSCNPEQWPFVRVLCHNRKMEANCKSANKIRFLRLTTLGGIKSNFNYAGNAPEMCPLKWNEFFLSNRSLFFFFFGKGHFLGNDSTNWNFIKYTNRYEKPQKLKLVYM